MNQKQKEELRKCLPEGNELSDADIEFIGRTFRQWAELVVKVWDRNKKTEKEPLRKEAL